MRKVLLVHLNPIELFPPVLNLIRFVEKEYDDKIELLVITTQGENSKKYFEDVSTVQIKRYHFVSGSNNKILKIFKYIIFNLRIFLKIILFRPAVIMYYETISVIPVFLYSLFKKPALFIHYHEYMNNEEYAATGFQQRLHSLEKKIYHKAKWISHTNASRLEFFKSDNGMEKFQNLRVMENFPSKNWTKNARPERNDGVLKFVYVGALSLQNMYIKEFLSWVSKQDKVRLDIYSQQDVKPLEDYISINALQNVFCRGFVEYDSLPTLLAMYNIGLIWYKPYSLNVIYSASNKLFEYISSGLEVWLSIELVGSLPYLEANLHPRIVQVDFNLEDSLTQTKNSYNEKPTASFRPYFYEDIYNKLILQWLN